MISTVDLEAADSPAMLDTAARTIGMFRLIGHGVDVSVIQEAHTTIRRVFATQEDECSAAGGLGFQALGAESLSGNAGADKSFTGDLKETFTVRFGQGVEVPWPAAVPDAEVALMSYDAAMTILADRLLGLADDALGLEAGTLPELCSNPSVVLRALHYPPSHSDQTRAGAHRFRNPILPHVVRRPWGSSGAVHPRLLGRRRCFADNGSGELWRDIRPADGGAWSAPLHRVAGQGDHRYTLAWFHAPARDRTITPLEKALAPGARPNPPITVGELLTERIKAQRRRE